MRRHAPPLVIIAPAGSGKTAVTLAKMREATGNVLYVTLSAYLAQTARRLYGAHGYENPRQDAEYATVPVLAKTSRGRAMPHGAQFAAQRLLGHDDLDFLENPLPQLNRISGISPSTISLAPVVLRSAAS